MATNYNYGYPATMICDNCTHEYDTHYPPDKDTKECCPSCGFKSARMKRVSDYITEDDRQHLRKLLLKINKIREDE